MRKIKDNGRTYKLVYAKHNCIKCCFNPKRKVNPFCPDEKCLTGEIPGMVKYGHWRETLPSKLSRLIKRKVRK